MPGEPVNAPPARPVTGLAGKLPAHGDFVRRGDGAVAGRFDRWLADALAGAATADRDTLNDRLRAMPTWRFAIVADSDVIAGAMIASHDKVGRVYPLVGFAVLPPALHAAAGDWSGQVAAALTWAQDGGATADALAARLAAIGIDRDAGSAADAAPRRSAWWSDDTGIRLAGPDMAFPEGADFDRLLGGSARDDAPGDGAAGDARPGATA